MEKADAIIALLGVLLTTGAGLGIAFFQEVPQPTEYRISWATSRVDFGPQSGSTTGDDPADFAFNVNAANVTAIEFSSSVTGAGPRPADDTVTIEVTGPGGRRFTNTATLTGQQSASVEVRAGGTLRDAPTTTGPVFAFSQGEADSAVSGAFTDSNATGSWTVRVSSVTTAAVATTHIEGHTIAVGGFLVRYQGSVVPTTGTTTG